MRKLLLTGLCLLTAWLVHELWPEDTGTPIALVAVKSPGVDNQLQRADPDARLIMLDGHPLSLTGNYLAADPEIVRLFDDWARAHNEEEFIAWKNATLDRIAGTLPAEAMLQLENWLDRYAELNLAMQLLDIASEPEWGKTLAEIAQLRDVYFHDSDRSLYGHVQGLEDFTRDAVSEVGKGLDTDGLARLAIRARNVSPQERVKVQGWLASLKQTLASDEWKAREPDARRSYLRARVAGLLEGPSILFGKEDAAFLQRYSAYKDERSALVARGADADALLNLREQSFGTPREQDRATALDSALAR